MHLKLSHRPFFQASLYQICIKDDSKGSAQDCSISSANTPELLQPSTKTSICKVY